MDDHRQRDGFLPHQLLHCCDRRHYHFPPYRVSALTEPDGRTVSAALPAASPLHSSRPVALLFLLARPAGIICILLLAPQLSILIPENCPQDG